MKIIGKPIRFSVERDSHQRIPIARYHRVALGLESGTEVYLAPVPPQNKSQNYIDEVILTTIRHSDWLSTYRLPLRLVEGEGVVADTLALIKDLANISIMESLTTDVRSVHELLLYISLTNPEEALSRIPDALKASKALYDPSIPVKLQPLDRLKKCALEMGATGDYNTIGTIHKGILECDYSRFWNMFTFKGRIKDEMNDRVMIFSDTEEKYMQLYFPRRNSCLLRFSVLHVEKAGAIHSFAEEIKLKKANILSSYSRLQSSGISAHWKAIVDLPNDVNASSIINAVASSATTQPYTPTFGDVELSFNVNTEPRQLAHPGYAIDDALSSKLFYGRIKEQDFFLTSTRNAIQNRVVKNFLYRGFSKSGKSTLIRRLKDLIESSAEFRDKCTCIWQSVTESSLTMFWDSLTESLSKAHSARVAPDHKRAAVRDNMQKISQALRKDSPLDPHKTFLQEADSTDKLILIFIEDGHHLIHPDDTIKPIAKEIMSNIAQCIEPTNHGHICWIITDSKSYLRNSTHQMGILDRFHQVSISQLSNVNDARLLIVEPFQKSGIHLEQMNELINDIITVSNLQPCYIQAICEKLYMDLRYSPENIDIIGLENLDNVYNDVASDSLNMHFDAAYLALSVFCNPQVLKTMLRKPYGHEVKTDRLLIETTQHDIDLYSFPCIQHSKRDQYIYFSNLFLRWAKITNRV